MSKTETEVAPPAPAEEQMSHLDFVIDNLLFAVKRAVGGKMYHDVYTIAIRPLILLTTVYASPLGGAWKALLGGLAVTAFILSFPFIMVKIEEASYMTKVHYPFMMSNGLGSKLKRAVMVECSQNMKEECSVCTILLGSTTELFLIIGSFLVVIGEFVSGNTNFGNVTVGVSNFCYSLYAFYKHMIECMEIMCFRVKRDGGCLKVCCGVCMLCLSEKSTEEKNLLGDEAEELKKLNDCDQMIYCKKELVVPDDINIESESFKKQFTKVSETNKELTVLNWAAIQKLVPTFPDPLGKTKKSVHPWYHVQDRYGFLTLPGAAKMIMLRKEDKIQFEKEKDSLAGKTPPWYAFLCPYSVTQICWEFFKIVTCYSYCMWYVDLLGKCWVAYGYVMWTGLFICWRWLITEGYNAERGIITACKIIGNSNTINASADDLKDLVSGEYASKIIYRTEIIETNNKFTESVIEPKIKIVKPIGRPMPFGFSILSPLKRFGMYGCLSTINPIHIGTPPMKYWVTEHNIMNVNTVADIMLRTQVAIPHDLFEGFPFTYWPFDGIYPNMIVEVALGLQLLREVMETSKLREEGKITKVDKPLNSIQEFINEYIHKVGEDDDKEKDISIDIIDAIREMRLGKPVIHRDADIEGGLNPMLDNKLKNSEPAVSSMSRK